MKLNLDTLFVSEDDGTDRGHILDFCHNYPERRAEVKGIFDRAWIDREGQHRDVVRAKQAEITEAIAERDDAVARAAAHEDTIARLKAQGEP